MIFVSGCGSVGYHWTGSEFWKYFDGNPMIIAASLAALFTCDELIRVRADRAGHELPAVGSRPSPWPAVNAIFWSAFAMVTLYMDLRPELQKYFPISFGLPACAFLAAILYAGYVTHKEKLRDDWKIISYAKLGIVMSLTAATAWIATESNCEEHPWLGYLHAHLFWHFGASYGLYLTLQFTVWFTAGRFGCRPFFLRGPRWTTICPMVQYEPMPVVMPAESGRPEAAGETEDDALRLLSTVPSFLPLRPDDLAELARLARRRTYASSEVVIQDGDEGASMFVVAAGQVGLLLPQPDGCVRAVTLSRGAIIGEMSLLTGRPRCATVQALTPSVIYEIHKDALDPILAARPALASDLTTLLTHRRAGTGN